MKWRPMDESDMEEYEDVVPETGPEIVLNTGVGLETRIPEKWFKWGVISYSETNLETGEVWVEVQTGRQAVTVHLTPRMRELLQNNPLNLPWLEKIDKYG